MIKLQFKIRDWYWIVAGKTQVFSSKAKGYVPVDNATYVAWLARKNNPTKTKTEADLFDTLAEQAPECLPYTAEGIEARRINLIGKLTTEKVGIVLATALFNQENRIRALEGKAPITKAQFIAALKAML